MAQTAETHLNRLADAGASELLSELGFDWSQLERNVCAALRFKGQVPESPAMVGLIGGASSGKSTLLNSLLGREVSRISAHAHETLGPIAAVPVPWAPRFQALSAQQLVFPALESRPIDEGQPSTGRLGAVSICPHDLPALANVILTDLPDVTSKMSADEGSTTRTLLPWFDGLIVVVDEERWYDAAVFDDTAEFARNFGPKLWVLFNRTERNEPLSDQERGHLAGHALNRHATGSYISPFQPGSGYRPLSAETQARVTAWVSQLDPADRNADLKQYLQRRCAEVVRLNVARAGQYNRLCRGVDRELDALTEETSLSLDLLTADERALLGLGRRFVPLYDAYRHVRRWVGRLGKWSAPSGEVAFEKRTELLAEVLRRNLEHRFHHATDRIGQIIAASPYQAGTQARWAPCWTMPEFDERDWATRVRAHIDAWKAETATQSRRSDVAALSVGLPLLLADLLFLGGAGLTFGWALASVAALLGGKSVATVVQRSPAFEQYRTTVQAYQSFVRQALADQWEANLAEQPRRHLSMTDPLLESVMFWSTPRKH
jgi:hypothetical protein